MLVGCVLLNQTSWKQVRPVLPELFGRYPDPESMVAGDPAEIAALIKSCGLQNRRTKTLQNLSRACLEKGWETAVAKLPGVGKYAYDSWMIFQLGDFSVDATDKELIKYLAWARELDPRGVDG